MSVIQRVPGGRAGTGACADRLYADILGGRMIGIVVNPYAKGVASDPLLPARLSRIGGRRVQVVETRNLREVSDAVRAFARSGAQVLATCGGDGTTLSVLSEMLHTYGPARLPRLAILRGGTLNTVAKNVGVRGSPEEILTRLVAFHHRGEEEPVEERPTLRVNAQCGFLFGLAMGARFIEAYYEARPGWLSASWLTARIAVAAALGTSLARRLFDPVRARIVVDGTVLPHDRWTLLMAATVVDVGLGVKITYRGNQRRDRFHLVASGLSPRLLARQFHRTFLARPMEGEHHFDLLPREAVLELERPEPYVMDGDLFRASTLVLSSGPTVRLSRP